jgi:hypothetical protein
LAEKCRGYVAEPHDADTSEALVTSCTSPQLYHCLFTYAYLSFADPMSHLTLARKGISLKLDKTVAEARSEAVAEAMSEAVAEAMVKRLLSS